MGPWSSGSLHTKDLPRGVKKKFSPGIVCSVTVPVVAAYWKSLNNMRLKIFRFGKKYFAWNSYSLGQVRVLGVVLQQRPVHVVGVALGVLDELQREVEP